MWNDHSPILEEKPVQENNSPKGGTAMTTMSATTNKINPAILEDTAMTDNEQMLKEDTNMSKMESAEMSKETPISEDAKEFLRLQKTAHKIGFMIPYYGVDDYGTFPTKHEKKQMDNDTCKKFHVTKETTDKIFGVQEVSNKITDMELRYEAKNGKEQLYRDQDNKYYLVTEDLRRFGDYPLIRKRVCLPVTRETALEWSARWFIYDDYYRALEEFLEPNNILYYIWRCQYGLGKDDPDYIREYLYKMNADTYVLLSNRKDYPLYSGEHKWVIDESGPVESYVYYITPEVARRWAVERGMGSDTYEKVFGCTSAS